jgi:hypothetical protein
LVRVGKRDFPPAITCAHRTRELFVLETYLQSRIPGSRLEKTQLPQAPELSLYLINEDYPRDGLTREQAEALMDNPPYWGFCWASGQVLGHCVLDNPDWVKGKTVVDFGAGSGVVGCHKMARPGGHRPDLGGKALRGTPCPDRRHEREFPAIEGLLEEDVTG